MNVREGGVAVKTAVLVATGVNADGRREVLGLREPHPGRIYMDMSFADLVVRGEGDAALGLRPIHL
jgi:putative transposase